MRIHFGCLPFLTLVFVGIGTANAETAAGQGIADNAGLFRRETLQQARVIVDDIERRHRQRVLVETFTRLPVEQAREFQSLDRKGKRYFFTRWANERARSKESVAVYILICREPANVRVVADSQADGGPLSDGQLMQVRKILEDEFEKNHYDTGLLRGLERVDELFIAASQPHESRFAVIRPWIIWTLAAVATFWLLSRGQRLVRRKLASMQPRTIKDIGEPGVGEHALQPNAAP